MKGENPNRRSAQLARPPDPDASPSTQSPTPPMRVEETNGMLHFSCDNCGKDLTPGESARYVVKMEAYAAADPAELTEVDLDTDHVEEMAQLLSELEEDDDTPAAPPARKAMRFDLCPGCYRKFVADPLGRDTAPKFDFSK